MYTWSKELETGYPAIDAQHRQWIDALNRLLEACAQGKGRDTIRETLIFLQDYTAKHFLDEEALQRKYQFPESKIHKQYHETFRRTVQEIIAEYDQEGATISLVGKINQNLGGWFINHIKKEDAKVSAHIRKSLT